MKKCPVCDWEIKDRGIEVKTPAGVVVVCCDECAKKVKTDPAQFTTARP